MNAPTPETAYVCSQCGPDKNGPSVHQMTHHFFPPVSEDVALDLDWTRKELAKTQRERDEARDKASAFEQSTQDERNIHMTTIAERDQLRKELVEMSATCRGYANIFEERNQLRKVADDEITGLQTFEDNVRGWKDDNGCAGAALQFIHHRRAALAAYNKLKQ